MSRPPGGLQRERRTVAGPLARIDVVTAKVVDFAPRVTLTGTIQAQVQNDLSFRLSGRIIERNVDIGDHVTADQVLARLDPRPQEADVEAAKAGVQSAEAQLKQATATFQRQKALIDSGFTTRTTFDQATSSGARSSSARISWSTHWNSAPRSGAPCNTGSAVLTSRPCGPWRRNSPT
jgi:membrane fusion protein, multidrug efflux system